MRSVSWGKSRGRMRQKLPWPTRTSAAAAALCMRLELSLNAMIMQGLRADPCMSACLVVASATVFVATGACTLVCVPECLQGRQVPSRS